ESLRNNSYELPVFNQLSRLVKHTKSLVNGKIFNEIYKQLTPEKLEMLDDLLKIKSGYNKTNYNSLKQLPRKPTISNFKELIKHHDWLISLGHFEKNLDGISKIK